MSDTKTAEEYLAEIQAGATNKFKIVSAREFLTGRPSTPEEQAADDAIDAAAEARWAAEDAVDNARDRVQNLHGEKAALAFDKFRVMEADEFAATEDTEPDWQVRGVIPTTGVGMHPGPSGTLKSFAELEIAACIHRGVPFSGRQVRRGRSVIVCAEGARGYRKRLRAYAKHHKVTLGELPAVITAAPNLFEPAQITALIEQLRLRGVTYVCLDTKWRCSTGADENSANDQLVVIGSMDRIARELGCFVMAVSHTGRDIAKGARGSSSQYAAMDVELTQERTGDYCTLRTTKEKDGEDGTAFTFKAVTVDLGVNAHGEPQSSLVLTPAEAADMPTLKIKGRWENVIVDYVRASAEQLSQDDLAEEVHTEQKAKGMKPPRKDNLKRTVGTLIKSGILEEVDDGVRLRPGVVRDTAQWLA